MTINAEYRKSQHISYDTPAISGYLKLVLGLRNLGLAESRGCTATTNIYNHVAKRLKPEQYRNLWII